MNLYDDKPKDPSEVDVFAFDWSPRLGVGETVASIFSAVLVNAAGATMVGSSNDDTTTRVTLSGGTAGERIVWTVLVLTSAARKIEEAFGVDVIDTVLGPPVETDITRLTREIAEAKAQRRVVALGNAVIDVWRDGRRVRKYIATLADLEAYIRTLEGELAQFQVAAGIEPTSRRSAIGIHL